MVPHERADPPPAKVGERTKLSGVGGTDAQDLAELIIRKRDGITSSARRRVLDAAQPDVGVAPGDGLIDRRVGDLDEAGLAAQPLRDELGDIDVEPDDARGVGGIGFDIRRAAFGVAGPPQERRRFVPKAWQGRPGPTAAIVETNRTIERSI